jgi:hypothetical protein
MKEVNAMEMEMLESLHFKIGVGEESGNREFVGEVIEEYRVEFVSSHFLKAALLKNYNELCRKNGLQNYVKLRIGFSQFPQTSNSNRFACRLEI